MKLKKWQLENIERMIDEFCEDEYGCKCDFSDLLNVGLPYTTDPETDEELQVTADLQNGVLTRYRNGDIECQILYDSYEDMLPDFANLDFDELTLGDWRPYAVYAIAN